MRRNQIQGQPTMAQLVLANNIYWYKVSPCHLWIIYGCFCSTTLESQQRDLMAHKAKNIYYLAIYRKSLPSPVPRISSCSQNKTLKKEWGHVKSSQDPVEKVTTGQIYDNLRIEFFK